MKFSLSILTYITFLAHYSRGKGSKSAPSVYEPTWESLNTRPLPAWYDQAKIGIFITWGLYSVPGFGSEWFWSNWAAKVSPYVNFMKKNYRPDFSYQEFAQDFSADFFNPTAWAELFEKSGAKYVIITSKHHEGYALWPSTRSFSWNSKDIGPHRDIVGELAAAIRKRTQIHFGLYYSLYEWFHPLYLTDKEANFSSNYFVVNKVKPEVIELVETYKPEIFWADGDLEPPEEYWQSQEFLCWLYNKSPVKSTIITNDRWGNHHIDVKSGKLCNIITTERYDPAQIQGHKWERAVSLDKFSWGYRRNMKCNDIISSHDLIKILIKTVSGGGNLLVNVGPRKDGVIQMIFEERLLEMGQWLNINGEAIYESKPWVHQNDSANDYTFYTRKDKIVYVLIWEWPKENVLVLIHAADLLQNKKAFVSLLGSDIKLTWEIFEDQAEILLPDKSEVKSNWAWTVKIVV